MAESWDALKKIKIKGQEENYDLIKLGALKGSVSLDGSG